MTAVAVLPSVETLVSGLVDYAGLFPPADLDLATAVRNYADYRADPHWRLLGRLVLPAARLAEFAELAEGSLPRRRTDEPWRLAVLAGPDVAADRQRIADFNLGHVGGTAGRAVVVAVEGRATTRAELRAMLQEMPSAVEVFVEVPLSPDPAPLLGELAQRGARAKVRTGGITPESIPRSVELAGFLVTAARAGVAFKATAGLHHAIRGEYPLTYQPDSPRAVMHGFLNVFVAASVVAMGGRGSEADAVEALEEQDGQAFRFGPGGIRWREWNVPTSHLRAVREQFGRSFGSCSFREPVDDLRTLRLV